MKFKQIPGKKDLKTQLIERVDQNTLPHALLLLGPQGSGKLAIAIALANYLLCQNKDGLDACGSCQSCLKTQKNVHPDIHFTFPVGKSGKKARKDVTSVDFIKHWRNAIEESPYLSLERWQQVMGDPTSIPNINTQECKNIIHNLSLQTFEAIYKVQIIWQAQFLRKEGNRLLKLIEEPAPNTLLILIAENEEALLNTIVSRCQIFKTKPFQDSEMRQYFEENALSINDEAIFLSSGNLAEAIVLQQGRTSQYSNLILDWMRVSWQSHPDTIFPFIDKLVALGKDERIFFLEYGIHFFRQFGIYLYTKDINQVRLTNEEKDTVLKMIKIINADKSVLIAEKLEEGLILLRRNINAKIMFTDFTFYFGQILRQSVA